MVSFPMHPHTEFGLNDHWEDASHSTDVHYKYSPLKTAIRFGRKSHVITAGS